MGWQTPELPERQEVAGLIYYVAGLGIGIFPLLIALIAVARAITYTPDSVSFVLFVIALTLYLLEIGVCIIMLTIEHIRPSGYGILTALLATPCVLFLIGILVHAANIH